MSRTRFEHVKISGITCVVPEDFIRIDDELAFFNNDVKLLERNKKILGLGKRHVADDVLPIPIFAKRQPENFFLP